MKRSHSFRFRHVPVLVTGDVFVTEVVGAIVASVTSAHQRVLPDDTLGGNGRRRGIDVGVEKRSGGVVLFDVAPGCVVRRSVVVVRRSATGLLGASEKSG